MLPTQKFLFNKLLINLRFQQSFFKYIAAKYEKNPQKLLHCLKMYICKNLLRQCSLGPANITVAWIVLPHMVGA